jgi:hypothetical protein
MSKDVKCGLPLWGQDVLKCGLPLWGQDVLKCGLPLWGQDVLKRILGLTEPTIKEDCKKLHNHKLNIGFSI